MVNIPPIDITGNNMNYHLSPQTIEQNKTMTCGNGNQDLGLGQPLLLGPKKYITDTSNRINIY
jgi:hypothetical protein